MMRGALGTAILLAAIGCGGGGPAAPPDAPPVDARVIDALPAPDSVMATGAHHPFVLDTITVPTTPEDAETFGFDLDGDGTVDNQLGNVASAFVQAGGGGTDVDLQAATRDAVDRGEVLLLVDLQATALDNASDVALSDFRGANPQPAPCTDPQDLSTCRQHLQGTGTFDVDPTSPPGAVLGGRIIGGQFVSMGNGHLVLRLSAGGSAFDLDLVAALAELNAISDSGFGVSRIGGAIPDDELHNKLVPAIGLRVIAVTDRDCPTHTGSDCGCTQGTPGANLMSIFDDNSDCSVSAQEFRDSSLTQTLFRSDVDTDGNGVADAFSVGVGVSAVAATWTYPG